MSIVTLKRHIVRLNANLNDLAFLRTQGIISGDEYLARKKSILRRIKEIREEIKHAKSISRL